MTRPVSLELTSFETSNIPFNGYPRERVQQLSTFELPIVTNSKSQDEQQEQPQQQQQQPQRLFHLSVDPSLIGSAFRYHHPKQLEKGFDLTNPYIFPLKYKPDFEKQEDTLYDSSKAGDDSFQRWLFSSKDPIVDLGFASKSGSSNLDDQLSIASPSVTMSANTFGEVPSYITKDWAHVGQEINLPWRLYGLPKYSFDESLKIKRQ